MEYKVTYLEKGNLVITKPKSYIAHNDKELATLLSKIIPPYKVEKYYPPVPKWWEKKCNKYVSDTIKKNKHAAIFNFRFGGPNTVCYVTDINGDKITGTSYYNPNDEYSVSIGQAVALCRAINGKDCDWKKIIGLE